MDYIPQFKDNAYDLSGYGDDATQQLELKRKLRMAQALQEQQGPEGQIVSGRYVAPSWTQYLANAVGKVMGAQDERRAIQEYGKYKQNEQKRMADALSKFGKTFEPKAEVSQGTFEIEKPTTMTQAPTSPFGTTEQLGATSPWTSNQVESTKTVQVPMSTTTMRQPTMDEVRAGFAQYAQDTRNPKLLEDMYMKQYAQLINPKEYDWKTIGNLAFQVDKTGKPTGQIIRNPKDETSGSLEKDFEYAKTQGYKGSIEDFKRISTSWLNPYQQQEIGIQREKMRQEEEKNNPLGLPKNKNNTSGNILNVAPKVKKVSLDNGTSVSATYDDRIGKYYVIQDGKKYWVEE